MKQNQTIHLIIPMSGQGVRYKNAGYTEPKPLIPILGTPMISRLLKRFPREWQAHFVLAENHRTTSLESTLRELRPSAQLQYIPPNHLGPGPAISLALQSIPDDEPVLISYCDFDMIWDPVQFQDFVFSTECDACLISYRGFHAHYLSQVPYAYSRLIGERVVEVREKGFFTQDRENEYASCGAYYFKSVAILKKALQFQLEKEIQCNGEYYTSLTVQALLLLDPQVDVRVFEIPYFFQWGTPQDLQRFEYWEQAYKAFSRYSGKPSHPVSQLLMPMAGLGTRFKTISNIPKPFIPIDREPMYLAALRTLPSAKNTVLVTLKTVAREIQAFSKQRDHQYVFLNETPPGQALSVAAGCDVLDDAKDVLVSSCDHGIAIAPTRWSQFILNPQCDAAIFTIKGFPSVLERPHAFAYVQTHEGSQSQLFPDVEKVSVKKPISHSPIQDHLLVGTFWFRTTQIMKAGIAELINRNLRVNGELYLDSVFECLIDLGHTVKIIPLDGYYNWGDPESLAETLYWKEVFGCRRIDQRRRFPGIAYSLESEEHHGISKA